MILQFLQSFVNMYLKMVKKLKVLVYNKNCRCAVRTDEVLMDFYSLKRYANIVNNVMKFFMISYDIV